MSDREQQKSVNQQALDTVIKAIDQCITDYRNWPDDAANRERIEEMQQLKAKLQYNTMPIVCGGRF